MKKWSKKVAITIVAVVIAVLGTCQASDQPLVTNIFYDTFVIDALSDVSVQTGIPIIADTTVSGFVTLDLVDVPFEEALNRICIPLGLTYRLMDGGYYLVGAATTDNPTFALLSDIHVVKVRYQNADTVSRLLTESYKPFVKVDSETNTIVITASPEMIARIQSDIAMIDRPIRQVMLQVLVTELSDGARKALGTEWQWESSKPSSNVEGALSFTAGVLTTALGYGPTSISDFLVALKAEVQKGKAEIHANPRIVTLDGKPAEIFLGEEQQHIVLVESESGQSISRQRIVAETGIRLKFTPRISDEGEITISVEPEVSIVTGTNKEGFPIIASRRASTTVRVRDGETFVLGGLVSEINVKSTTKVPLLGDLPLLGKLFRSENSSSTETEILIMVTPVILDGSAAAEVL
ncbi:MAG: secretin N-terminal domain-containing protein [Bacillota bacterium]|nr:secretin N-terminal domain-containing protein [Bacillota bacterium]HPZ54828.1 secretin N-terminal domain-containing protein [Bacillota bacterium]HQD17721.1 secretin N-terminal domain-containing protein [Bacillota bacterium]